MSVTAVSILVDRHGTTPLLLAKKCSYILSYKQKECKRSPGVSISFSSSCKVAHFFFNCTCARFERPISTFGLLYTSSGTNWKVVQSTKPRSMRKHVATLMFTICIARTAGIPHATATRKMRSKCPSSTMVYGCKRGLRTISWTVTRPFPARRGTRPACGRRAHRCASPYCIGRSSPRAPR